MPPSYRKKKENIKNNKFVHFCQECEVIWASNDGQDNICLTCNRMCPPQTYFLYVCACKYTWSSNLVNTYGQHCIKCNNLVDPQLAKPLDEAVDTRRPRRRYGKKKKEKKNNKFVHSCEDCEVVWTSNDGNDNICETCHEECPPQLDKPLDEAVDTRRPPQRGRKKKEKKNNKFVHSCEDCEVVWTSNDGNDNICETCHEECPPQLDTALYGRTAIEDTRKPEQVKFVHLCQGCRIVWESNDGKTNICLSCRKKCPPHSKLLYACKCYQTWSSNNVDTYGQNCSQCGELVQPQLKSDNSMFGKYKCPECKRLWMSGWAYVGYRQKCRKCLIFVEPYYIVPKEKPEAHFENKCNPNKAHESTLCEKCLTGVICNRLLTTHIS